MPLAELLVAEGGLFTRNSTVITITSSTEETWVQAVINIVTRSVQSVSVVIEPEYVWRPGVQPDGGKRSCRSQRYRLTFRQNTVTTLARPSRPTRQGFRRGAGEPNRPASAWRADRRLRLAHFLWGMPLPSSCVQPAGCQADSGARLQGSVSFPQPRPLPGCSRSFRRAAWATPGSNSLTACLVQLSCLCAVGRPWREFGLMPLSGLLRRPIVRRYWALWR